MLRYSVEEVSPSVGIDMVCIQLARKRMHHADKVIVFVLTKTEVEEISDMLFNHIGQILVRCHSDMSVDKRKKCSGEMEISRMHNHCCNLWFRTGSQLPSRSFVHPFGLSPKSG